jgi:hypothetical protein
LFRRTSEKQRRAREDDRGFVFRPGPARLHLGPANRVNANSSPGCRHHSALLLLQLAVYGVALTRAGSAFVEARKTGALINLVAIVGVALYTLTRVRTTRQRNIVLGCLAMGLTFACLVGSLQSLTHIDLRLFFQPPGS